MPRLGGSIDVMAQRQFFHPKQPRYPGSPAAIYPGRVPERAQKNCLAQELLLSRVPDVNFSLKHEFFAPLPSKGWACEGLPEGCFLRLEGLKNA